MLLQEILGALREKKAVGDGGDLFRLLPDCFQGFQLPFQGPSFLLFVQGHLQRQSGRFGQFLDQPEMLFLDGSPRAVPHRTGPEVVRVAGSLQGYPPEELQRMPGVFDFSDGVLDDTLSGAGSILETKSIKWTKGLLSVY